MSDFNDFGFSTVSTEEYQQQQVQQVDVAREVATTATSSITPELEKMNSKISTLTDSMRVLQDDLETRKEELKDKWAQRMNEVEELVLPLLRNLAKDGDQREWIRWPNRTDILNKQIDKITSVTRSDF
jgi:predicted transcriptional regulator